MRNSAPTSTFQSTGYAFAPRDEGPYASPTSPTFRKESLPPAGESSTFRRGEEARSNHHRRQAAGTWPALRHLAGNKGVRVLLAVLTLVGLHQVAFSSSSNDSVVPVYSTVGTPPYRQVVDKTLSRVRLSLGGKKDTKFITDLEKRLSNAPLPPYNFLVGTMQQNEGQDILEWLLYHISQGMDHFIIYDHFSTDTSREILQPFVDLGWVTYDPWNRNTTWVYAEAFDNFMGNWQKRSKWLVFLDVDEFITRNESLLVSTSPDALDEPLATWFDRKYDSYGGVALPRLSFSSNGHYHRPAGSVLESYTEARAVDESFEVPKVMHQGKYRTGGDMAAGKYRDGRVLADSKEQAGEEMWDGVQDYPVYIHHYWAKSWDECVARIEQSAFQDSWRASIGEAHCRSSMTGTEEHASIAHHRDAALAKFAAPLRVVAERFQQTYPVFSTSNYTLSTLISSYTSSRREPLPVTMDMVAPGAVFVVDNTVGEVGFLDVILSSSTSKRYLPITYRSDGGASFAIPPVPSLGFYELSVTFQHPSVPGPEIDPVSPCTVAGHFRDRPEVYQLQQFVAGVCKETDLDGVWHEAQVSWPHNHYRGIRLFRRFFKVVPDSSSSFSTPSLPFASTALSPVSAISLTSLGVGRWQRFPLDEWPAASSSHPDAAVPGTLPRLYSPTRCPRNFPSKYWGPHCTNDTVLAEQGGMYRFLPDGATSYTDYALSCTEVKSCFAPAIGRPKRFKIIGDSVASHTYAALQCLFNQVELPDWQHLKFDSFQYESFSLTGVGGLAPLTVEEWTRLVAWEYDDVAKVPLSMPDAIMFNSGLWPVSWGTASGYDKGLRAALPLVQQLLRTLNRQVNDGAETQLLWRETTAVSPGEPGGDPIYQTNPRVELYNSIANRVTDDLGIRRIPAYEMTASRRDAARDNAHICPPVQGDMAELLVYSLCKGGIL